MSAKSKAAWLNAPGNRERDNARRRAVAAAKREGLPLPAIQDGWGAHQVTTTVGPDGDTRQQSIIARPEGEVQFPIVGPGMDLAGTTTLQRGDGKILLQWVRARQNALPLDELLAAIREHVADHVRPLPPIDAPEYTLDDLLTAYCLGDPHIGMLAWAPEVGEHFDLRIAVRELTQCMRNLVARAPASQQAIVTNLGDFFHSSDNTQRTPHGNNKLDVDGRFGKVARVGLDMMVSLIEAALQKHEHVKVRNVPGNHDEGVAFWIAEVLRREFKDDPRVEVCDAYAPYQYDEFGNVMLGWAHTDGAKPLQLGGVMAADQPEMWGRTIYRHWHGGHVHHLSRTEVPGCTVETHRTLAGKDAWHNWKGYRSGRSLQAITYHRKWGEDGRVTESIERVRASILGAA